MYQKTDIKKWSGRVDDRNDPQTFRWHQLVGCYHLFKEQLPEIKENQRGIALLGYCCDEGVRRNQGRTGAKEGPEALRNALGPLAYHLDHNTPLVDAGDVHCVHTDLEGVQEELAQAVVLILEQEYFPVVLGGGHDMAWGHYQGIARYLQAANPKARLGIINFDAHFDLRSFEKGANSGTPFLQMAKHRETGGLDFRYLCLGIQPCANAVRLFETAQTLGVDFIESSDMHLYNLEKISKKVKAFADALDFIYITIDLDGFAAAHAPGVSAPAHCGYPPDMVVSILRLLSQSSKVISLDIAELNPRYDIDHRTARLAAFLVHDVIHHIIPNPVKGVP